MFPPDVVFLNDGHPMPDFRDRVREVEDVETRNISKLQTEFPQEAGDHSGTVLANVKFHQVTLNSLRTIPDALCRVAAGGDAVEARGRRGYGAGSI